MFSLSASVHPYPDRVKGWSFVRSFHHRNSVTAVTGPCGALDEVAIAEQLVSLVVLSRHLDLHGVGIEPAATVLDGLEELRLAVSNRSFLVVVQDTAGDVVMAALQAVFVEQRRLDVVATLSGAQEAVAHEVASAHPEGEALAGFDLAWRVDDQQRRVLGRIRDLSERSRHAGRRLLEAIVRRELRVSAVPGEDVERLAVVFDVGVVVAVASTVR